MSGRWSKRIFLKERKPVSKLDPRQTLITLPNEIPWQVPDVAPPDSVAEAVLVGAEEQEGTYLVLMKWFPGWMSAPHTYVTDRLCVVLSGVWWCNSGPGGAGTEGRSRHPGGLVGRVAAPPSRTGPVLRPPSPEASRSARMHRSGTHAWTRPREICGAGTTARTAQLV